MASAMRARSAITSPTRQTTSVAARLPPSRAAFCGGVSLGANRFARQQGAQLGGVKFEFDVKGQVTEMTAIYTVCLHTVQTVPWYR